MQQIQALLLDQQKTWASEDQFGRRRLVDDFDNFVGQRLRQFAETLVTDDTPEQIATVLARLCDEFLQRHQPDPWSSLDIPRPRWWSSKDFKHQVDALTSEAREIRARATELGLDWDFEYESGIPLDPGRQEPWGSCDPGSPVAFAVIPACVRGTDLYRRQSVYTGEC
jgi:hypothetical protein